MKLRAVSRINPEHEAQVPSYRRATRFAVGPLLSFGGPRPDLRRIVWRHDAAGAV